MIKILFFASNPAETPILALDEEIRAIQEKIRAAEYRNVLQLLPQLAARPDDFLQHLNEYRPQIVHFSGHGSHTGEIIMMDTNRNVKPVSDIALKKLFTTLKDNIRVVVLNACYSQIQAEAIRQVIDCVIGMSRPISDSASISFASSFYRAIGFGRSVQDAFDQGIASLLMEGIPENETPQLLLRPSIDASTIFLLESEVASKLTIPPSPYVPPNVIPATELGVPHRIESDPHKIIHVSIEHSPMKEGADLGDIFVDICLGLIKEHLAKQQPSNRDTADALMRVLMPVCDNNITLSGNLVELLVSDDYLSQASGGRYELTFKAWSKLLRKRS